VWKKDTCTAAPSVAAEQAQKFDTTGSAIPTLGRPGAKRINGKQWSQACCLRGMPVDRVLVMLGDKQASRYAHEVAQRFGRSSGGIHSHNAFGQPRLAMRHPR